VAIAGSDQSASEGGPPETIADAPDETPRGSADATTQVQPPATNREPPSVDRPRVVQPFPFITVNLDTQVVELDGFVCLDVGWLEQVVCSPGTREHETLVVSEALPSNVHAALLLAGHEPGSPGRWTYDNNQVAVTPPTGPAFDVFVRYEATDGSEVTEPISNWIRDHLGEVEFPDDPWIFGGSMLALGPEGREVYVADYSGSIIGLVTFGDEVIGFENVLADQHDIQPREWEVDPTRIPPMGTPVTVILRPRAPARGG
jgi:hypothetical protein